MMPEYLPKYIRQGIKVFACYQNKTPKTKTGFYAATTSFDDLLQQFDEPDLLIGLPTGNVNHLVVIDIDVGKPMQGSKDIDPRSADEIIEELKSMGEVPDTFSVETPSGGRHLYFSVEKTNLSSSVRFFHKTLPIDVRGNGGYVITVDGKSAYSVYDDVNGLDIENLAQRCAPLPEWIEEYRKPYSEVKNEKPPLPESEIREIRSALAYLSSDDRDTWIRMGMALKSTGSIAARGLWDEWSQKSEKYDAQDQTKRWNTLKPKDITIASLFHEAKNNGWVTTYEKKEISEVILPGEETEEVKKEFIQQFKKKPFPDSLLTPPGLVGDIIQYILETSIKPQPVYALAASLCAVGALAGRKVQTETKLRTNIYCLCVGASGSGKEAPRKAVKELFYHAGCGNMACVEDIASDSAINTILKAEPSQIFLLDEIGRFLKTTTSASKSTHLYNVVTTLLKLYSSADQEYHGKIYADSEKKVSISQPNLCLYGTTVPDTLYKGLNLENVVDGFLSRMLIFETDTSRPPKQRRRNLIRKPPLEIIDQIKALKTKQINMMPMGDLDHMNPEPQLVPLSPTAITILDEFDDYIENLREKLEEKNQVEAIYNRTVQLSEQVALIIATGRNIDNPMITDEDIIYGIELAKYLSDHMAYVVNNYIANNDLEHEVKRILHIIRMSGKVRKSEITRKTQNLQGYLRNDIIETLKESDQIEEMVAGSGSSKTIWYIAKDIQKLIT